MELNVESSSVSSSTKTQIDLIQLIKSDPELLEFFRFVHQYDLWEKAAEALSNKMKQPKMRIV